jgi:hypothetical protein
MEKQTAIQEMIDELDYDFKASGLFVNWEFYLQREKENIIDTYIASVKAVSLYPLDDSIYRPDAEQYYNETFTKKETHENI